ncbi:hypothetical protein, partial [Klebsiella pneumoniae]|uniref:hypothetical protein n=1 Tax=Klebsiella pneumoniae TaxID=573 RepID=UPI0037C08A96
LMMSLWDALRMNMMISYQELVRTFLSSRGLFLYRLNGILGLLSLLRSLSIDVISVGTPSHTP